MIRKNFLFLTCFCILAAAFTLAGCSYQSVLHLNRKPWTLDQKQHLNMNYLSFNFVCQQAGKGYLVKGQAYPKKETIPDWADWTDEIWIGAYISDQKGKVLAKQIKVLPSQEIDWNRGYDFSFSLRPQNMGSAGPIFVNFGYRLVLKQASKEKSPPASATKESFKGEVFFASESALTRF